MRWTFSPELAASQQAHPGVTPWPVRPNLETGRGGEPPFSPAHIVPAHIVPENYSMGQAQAHSRDFLKNFLTVCFKLLCNKVVSRSKLSHRLQCKYTYTCNIGLVLYS